MSHPNAPLTPVGRLKLIVRILDEGRSVTQATDEMGVSRQCGYYWLNRFRNEGVTGLIDRSSRPHASPRQTPPEVEEQVVQLRREEAWGPQRIAQHLQMVVSTVCHPQALRAQLPALS